MDPAETLSLMIEALTEEKSLRARRTYANRAHVALRELRERVPPANATEAETRGLQKGLLLAIRLAKEARNHHEEDVTAAAHVAGAAYTVMNGVLLYGQQIISTFEKLAQRAALDGPTDGVEESKS